MSKKKPTGKRRSKANGAYERSVNASRRRARRGARSQALPGMEQVRNQRLDNVCEAIADEREAMNQAKTEERGLIASALEAMHKANVTVYHHGGIELVRVPGAEKLRVRVMKEQGDATVETGAESAENLEQSGDAHDAE